MKKKECYERIKEALELRDLKQVDIINLTGIKKSALSQYISGKILPRQKNLHKLALALNVDEAWLMGYDVDMKRNSSNKNTFNGDPRVISLNKREFSQYEKAMNEAALFFQDDEISEEDKQKMVMAINEMFFRSKEINKEKYKKKNTKDEK